VRWQIVAMRRRSSCSCPSISSGALADRGDAPAQLVLLPLDQLAVVPVAEQLAERAQVAQQGSGGFDVLDQPPELGQ
jgi:hypothetical protein